MGVELIVIGASLAIAAAVAAYSMYAAKKGLKNDLGPQSLDQQNITQATEGSVVPLVYGRVRLPGNIIWYGNMVTEPIEPENQGGGKGFGGDSGAGQVTSWRYYCDVWQSIGIGKLNLIKTYINDIEDDLLNHCSSYTWNDGTQTVYPTEPGEWANKIKGVAHIFIKRLYLGENTTNMPTIHFVVERVLDTGLANENMANGNNPAAIVYDILVNQAGVSFLNIYDTSFIAAAAYWYNKGYGLNLNFSQQKSASELIANTLSFVDGSVYIRADGKYAINDFNPDKTPVDTFVTADFIDFSFHRPTYSQLPNDFKATYIDQDQDFSQRVVITQNQAHLEMVGQRYAQSLDLTAFRDVDTASKRMMEMAKQICYPAPEIEFKSFMYASLLVVGDIITVSYSFLGIANAKYRVMSVEQPKIDSHEIGIKCQLVYEGLFDTHYLEIGGTEYEKPGINFASTTQFFMINLPYTKEYGINQKRLVLAQKANSFETGFSVLSSTDGVEYRENGYFTTYAELFGSDWKYKGASGYPAWPNTMAIDDEGIEFTMSDADHDFSLWPDLSRAELFTTNRFLLLEEEILAFQRIEQISTYVFKVRGLVRGCFGTDMRRAHPYIVPPDYALSMFFKIKDNLVDPTLLAPGSSDVPGSPFIKVLPHFFNRRQDPAAGAVFAASDWISAHINTYTNYLDLHVTADRAGSTVTFQIFPVSPRFPNAHGMGNADEVTDVAPSPNFPSDGTRYKIYYPVTPGVYPLYTEQSETSFIITDAGSFTIYIVGADGYFQQGNCQMIVGVADGHYAGNRL